MANPRASAMNRTATNLLDQTPARPRTPLVVWLLASSVFMLGVVLALIDWQIQSRQLEEKRVQQSVVLGRQLAGALKAGVHQFSTLLKAFAASSSRYGTDLSEDAVRDVLDELRDNGTGFTVQGIFLADTRAGTARLVDIAADRSAAAGGATKELRNLAIDAGRVAQETGRVAVVWPWGNAPAARFLAVTLPLKDSRSLGAIVDLDTWLADQAASYGGQIVFRLSDVSRTPAARIFDGGGRSASPEYSALLMTDLKQAWQLDVWSGDIDGNTSGLLLRALVLAGLGALAAFLVGSLAGRSEWAEGRTRKVSMVLAENRKRLARALEVTRDGVWEYSPADGRLLVSDRCTELLGIPATPVARVRAVLRLFGREERSRILKALGAAWQEAGSVDELVHIARPGLGKRWMRIRARTQPAIGVVTGAISDVTEEVEQLRLQKLNQEYMARLIDSLPIPVSVKNADLRVVLVNHAFCETFGVSAAEVRNSPIATVLGTELVARSDDLDLISLETGQPQVTELWQEGPRSGRRLFLRVSVSRSKDTKGNPVVITTYEDQTTLRNYAERMHDLGEQTQGFVQRLINALPYPVYVMDHHGRYLMVNERIANQHGIPSADLIGRLPTEVFGEEYGSMIEDEDHRVAAGIPARREDVVPDPHTEVPRYWMVTKGLTHDIEGHPVIVGSNFEVTAQRRAEKEISAALDQQTRLREFLQRIFDAIPAPLAVKDASHRYVLTNLAHRLSLGRSTEEILGKSTADLNEPYVAAEIDRMEDDVLRMGPGHTREREFRLVYGQAEARSVILHKAACLDPDGNRLIVTVSSDVTELRAEQARQQSMRGFYQTLFDAVPQPVTVKDSRHIYVMVNRAYCDVYRRAPEEVVGCGSWDFNSPEEVERTIRLDDAAFAAEPGVVTEREARLTYGDGSIHEVLLRKVVCLDTEGNRYMITVNGDITALRAEEARLRRVRDYLHALFDAIPDPVVVKTSDHVHVMVNNAHARAYGLRPDEMVGKTTLELYPPEEVEAIIHADDLLFGEAVGKVTEREMTLQYADGVQHQVVARNVISLDPDGNKLLISMFHDVSALRQADRELRLSLERQTRMGEFLQAVFDALPFVTYVKDESLNYLMSNRAHSKFVGLRAEDIVGRHLSDFASEEEANEVETIERGMLGGEEKPVIQHEMILHDARGRPHEFVLHKSVTLDADGRQVIIGINHDVTVLREAERKLRDAFERLSSLIQNAPIGIALFARGGGFETANPFLCQMIGRPERDLLGRHFLMVVPERLHALAREKMTLSIERGVVGAFDMSLTRADGSEMPAMVSGVTVHRPGDYATWVLVVDLTELKRTEQAYRESEARWQFALQGAGDGVWDWNLETNAVYYSPRWIAMLGYAEGEIGDQLHEWRNRIHPDDREHAIASMQAHLSGDAPVYVSEYRLQHKEGRYIWILDRGKIIERDFDGKPTRMIGTHADITRSKLSEMELMRHRDQLRELVSERTADLLAAKERAEQANAAKSEFLANMSHELRTPMHAILSFARLGEERAERLQRDKLRDYFSRVRVSGDRLLSLLNDLLDLSKLEAGRMKLELQRFSLTNVLDEAAREFEALFLSKRLKLLREYAPDLPRLQGDPVRIGQVARNLLSNAAKFTPEDRSITLRAVVTTLEVGEISATAMDVPALEFVVADEGIGIPQKELGKVFEKFVQSSLTRTSAGGTGLGLAICREIVHAHGGMILARGRPGGGTEFVVRLPLGDLDSRIPESSPLKEERK